MRSLPSHRTCSTRPLHRSTTLHEPNESYEYTCSLTSAGIAAAHATKSNITHGLAGDRRRQNRLERREVLLNKRPILGPMTPRLARGEVPNDLGKFSNHVNERLWICPTTTDQPRSSNAPHDATDAERRRLQPLVGQPIGCYAAGMTITARVREGRLVLDEPTTLPEGTQVALLPLDPGDWLDDTERTALHTALGASDADVAAGRLMDAPEVLRRLRTP
jgi:hypothetical protein